MKKSKRKLLENQGWRVGTADEFLGLSEDEIAIVDMRLRLSQALRERRKAEGLSQAALAKKIRSSQSRVAKMEAADRTVSIDLLIRGLVATGATPNDIADVIKEHSRAA